MVPRISRADDGPEDPSTAGRGQVVGTASSTFRSIWTFWRRSSDNAQFYDVGGKRRVARYEECWSFPLPK